jgi:hypothetical protein
VEPYDRLDAKTTLHKGARLGKHVAMGDQTCPC